MKLKKRIIFTLLYSSGKFVLSRNFRLQNIGNLNWLIKNYNFNNVSFFIDELIILDVSRGERSIKNFSEVIKIISQDIFVPITAGGGINSIKDVKKLLDSGADKVVLNKNLLIESELADEISTIYGKQCLVGSLDTRYINGNYFLYSEYGENLVGTLDECFQKFKISERVGEIYINSIDIVNAYNHINYKLKYLCGFEVLYYNSLLCPKNWKEDYDIREILKDKESYIIEEIIPENNNKNFLDLIDNNNTSPNITQVA